MQPVLMQLAPAVWDVLNHPMPTGIANLLTNLKPPRLADLNAASHANLDVGG